MNKACSGFSPFRKPSERGFTLMEVVIGLIVTAILGSMLFTLLQTSLMQSSRNVLTVRNAYNLEAVMENINSDYISRINPETAGSSLLDDLMANLNTANYYHSSYSYTVDAMLRFNEFVDGADPDTLIPGDSNPNGGILRVTISDSSGMILSALFFDNNL
jgi:prepilin-type N-terminal cleavage/methylation domain-containing protein